MSTDEDPVRRAAQYRVDRMSADDGAAPAPQDAPAEGRTAAARRMERRGEIADELIRQAMARGEFDDLAYAGKPIPGIGGTHDPDWWVKGLIEREQITGVLPEALQLRKDDAALDARLDREVSADDVRRVVEEFNARVVVARRQLLGGPPVVTPTRDVEQEVARWSDRRRERRAAAEAEHRAAQERAAAEAAARRAARRLRLPWRHRPPS